MHTTASGYIASALFVLGISAYFMLKNRHFEMAKRSFVLASSFGILSSLFVLFSGDEAAYQVAQKQPMKLAAMEGLYKGEINSEIVIFGILNPAKRPGDDNPPYLFKIAAPFALGLMATRGLNNFTPGIDDLVYGNATQKITPTIDKIASGKIALNALSAYKKAKDTNDTDAMAQNSQILGQNIANFGYGYIKKPEHIVPPVALTFYSFHIMVMLGCYFIALFFLRRYFYQWQIILLNFVKFYTFALGQFHLVLWLVRLVGL